MSDLQKHIDQIKATVYSNNPAPCDLIDDICASARRLDQYTAQYGHISPIETDIVELLWVAHGSPTSSTQPENGDGIKGTPARKSSKR